MARIKTYEQDSTLNKADKVLGTDSATGATKNYTIESILNVANEANLVESFDGAAFEFQDYVDPAGTVNGVLNINAGSATDAAFSSINTIYISVNDKSGSSLREYLENADNDFIKISKTDNLNQFGIYEITNIEDYGSNKYKKLSVTPRGTNGTLTVGVKYFVANYSALYDQDFSDDSVTEFGDVSHAGSGRIITEAERNALSALNANALLHGDVVDNVTSTATNVPLSANQGRVLKGLIDAINTLLEVDTEDAPALDTLREIVNFCQTNASTLSSLGIGSINGLQDALNSKQNSESGKGLSEEDFTSVLKSKLEGIEAQAQVNVKPNWSAASGTDAEILNKPTDLTNLSLHNVTSLSDVNSAGSGSIITGDERNRINPSHSTFIGISNAERIKLTNIDVNATTRVVTDGTDSITVPPQNAEQNVQANWDEQDSTSDAFIQNKPSVVEDTTTITVQGTTNEVEVTPDTAQDLTANRTVTIGLPDDVTISGDLTVNETIELANAQTTTPTFDNGLYYTTEDNHDVLHFRYHGHDLSIDHLTENIPTGILNGGILSTNTNTTFDISAGDGVINILNKGVTDPHPEIKKVAWTAQTGVAHTLGDANNTDQLNTWVYIDSSGNVQQTLTIPSPSLWRNNIVLGSIIHSENIIRFVKTFPRTAYSNGNTVSEFIEIFGPLKKSGHLITANTTNTMRIDRSAGVAFGLGRNYQTDAEEPNLVSDGASTPVFHRYSSTSTGFTKDDGTAGAGYADIDPSKYDNSGTLATVSGGNFSVQRLYHFPNNTNVIVAYYGKNQYSSIDEAERNYLLEDFQEAENTSSQAIYLGALIVKGNATDLTDSGQAKILVGGIFRSLAATNLGGVAADATLNDLGDVTISGPQNGDVLKYNSSTGEFENNSGSVDGTGVANKLAIWSDADTLTNDPNLHWDDTNDRLGIGTSSPSGNLDIQSSSALTLRIGNSSGVNGYQLKSNVSSSADYGFIIEDYAGVDLYKVQAGTSGSHHFSINGSEKMRIDSSGKVGIGTTAPQSLLHQHVSDSGINYHRFTNNATGVGSTDGFIVGIGATEHGVIWNYEEKDLIFGVNSTEQLRIKSNGKVGIGTDSPATSLDIDATDAIIVPKGTDAERNALTAESGMFRFNTTSSEFEGYNGTEWGAIAGSGGGASAFAHMQDVGDGSTTSFALGNTPSSHDQVMVYLEGVYQEKATYSISGSNIVFNTAPPNGYSIEVKYLTGVLDLTDVGEVILDELTGDGTATYALSATPQSENYTNVYIEGVYQEKGTYSVSGANITFSSNVPTGYSIEVSTMRTIPAGSVTQTTFVTDTFTANGSTNNFTLVNGSPSSKSLTMVFIQGVYQAKSNYNLVSGQIQFGSTPSIDDIIEVISISAANTAGSPVTSVNGEVGAVSVVSKHNVSVISANATAVANTLYVFTANLNLTLPASPAMGDSIKISNRSGVATCQLLRNGNNILGAAADLTLDTASASFELVYTDTANGWVIIGQ